MDHSCQLARCAVTDLADALDRLSAVDGVDHVEKQDVALTDLAEEHGDLETDRAETKDVVAVLVGSHRAHVDEDADAGGLNEDCLRNLGQTHRDQ